jgi:hypothetical protein
VRPQHSRLVRCLDHSPSLRRAKPEACWGLQGWGICGCRCLCVCVCGGGGGGNHFDISAHNITVHRLDIHMSHLPPVSDFGD